MRSLAAGACCVATVGCGGASTPTQQVRDAVSKLRSGLMAQDVRAVCPLRVGVRDRPPPISTSPAALAAQDRECERNAAHRRFSDRFRSFHSEFQGQHVAKITVRGGYARVQLLPRRETLVMMKVNGAWRELVPAD